MNRARVMVARCGVTLAEILVVVVLIAVLASLLFAVIGYGIRRTHQSTCMNNLRQLVAAFALYAADYDNRLRTGLATRWAGLILTGPAHHILPHYMIACK